MDGWMDGWMRIESEKKEGRRRTDEPPNKPLRVNPGPAVVLLFPL